MFGALLTTASRKFKVTEDPRIEKVWELLPGSNCGACGFAGCREMAEAIVSEGIAPGCPLLGEKEKEEIAKFLGREHDAGGAVVVFPHLLCHGGNRARDRYQYRGPDDCVAADILLKGRKDCEHGCLGLATCVEACPFGVMRMEETAFKCDLCGGDPTCVKFCPMGAIKYEEPNEAQYNAVKKLLESE